MIGMIIAIFAKKKMGLNRPKCGVRRQKMELMDNWYTMVMEEIMGHMLMFFQPKIRVLEFVAKPEYSARLVGGLEHVCPYIGNVIIPTDELHHFSEG